MVKRSKKEWHGMPLILTLKDIFSQKYWLKVLQSQNEGYLLMYELVVILWASSDNLQPNKTIDNQLANW